MPAIGGKHMQAIAGMARSYKKCRLKIPIDFG